MLNLMLQYSQLIRVFTNLSVITPARLASKGQRGKSLTKHVIIVTPILRMMEHITWPFHFGHDFCNVQPWFQQETTLPTSSPCDQRCYCMEFNLYREHAESLGQGDDNTLNMKNLQPVNSK